MKNYLNGLGNNGWQPLQAIHNLWEMRSLWLGHTVAWTIIMLTVWIGTWIQYPEQSLWAVPFVVGFTGICWYGLFFICEVLLYRRRWYEALFIISVFVLMLVPFSFLILHRFLPAIGLSITEEWQKFDLAFTFRIWSRLKVFVLSSFLVVFLLRYRKTDSKLNAAVKEYDILKERSNELEYKALVNEVYPHFTFNMVNSIYADVQHLSKELAHVVGTTAELLRYCLTSSRGTVVIDRELHFLQRFIEMQQWRFRNQVHVSFKVIGSCSGQRVLPMAMIALVKNAYKHGYLNDPDSPLYIVVKLGEDRVSLICRNKVRQGDKKADSLGSGLKNIEKRLKFVFGERGNLTYHNNGTYFHVEMTIKQ